MTITEFLQARIAEDEDVARVFDDVKPRYYEVSGMEPSPEYVTVYVSPARVLAECAAKRTIIDQAFRVAAQIDGEWGCCHSAKSIRADEPLPDYCYGPEVAAQFLAPLAAIYADHPDYDTAWRTV